jgi:2-methylcitrate dehydratase PrpD
LITASERFAAHVAGMQQAALPSSAQQAVQHFTLDTIGVGVAGASQVYARGFGRVFAKGQGKSSVWGGGLKTEAAAAAAINAFQAHCQEFDCVHEAAVLHPFTVVVPVLMAEAQATGTMSGATYVTACAAGVNVAVGLGVAATSQIRFFRPATCGLFGAVAALAQARGLSPEQLTHAFGYALAFAAGTMQAHVEGTPALAASVGHAARAAFDAVDLAEAGLPGPRGAIDGPFGYLALFEASSEIAPVLESLGQIWRVSEVSWKPFPTGRAAHGGIDMALQLRAQGLTPENLQSWTVFAPPLIHHLVGRPIQDSLEVNYARLCLPYCAAHAFLFGSVSLEAFTPEALSNRQTHALAKRIEVVKVDNGNAAAFTPQRSVALTTDGRRLEASVEALLGSPLRPLTREAQLAKFRACTGFAGLAQERTEEIIAVIDALPDLQDVARIAQLAGGGSSP